MSLCVHKILYIFKFFRGFSFSKMVWNLGELRSLVPSNTMFMVLTATATTECIFDCLHLSISAHVIQRSPNRSNLRYSVQYVDIHMPLEIIFSKFIDLVGKEGIETKRTLIYC